MQYFTKKKIAGTRIISIFISLVTSTCLKEIDRGVFYNKITELNYFPLPCKLGNSELCVVLACALPSIHGYSIEFGSSLYLNWIVFLFSVGIVLSVNVEQRVNVKFCVKLGKSASETYDLLKKDYGDECLSCTQVFEWFKEGREEIGDDQQISRPSTSKTDANIEKVGEIARKNCRLSIRVN
jgi:hypothetical protein